MNIEICKKCNYKPFIYFHIFYEDRAYLTCKQGYKMFDMGNINKLLIKEIAEYLKRKGPMDFQVATEFIPDILLKKIEINKRCPYYMEHKLNDWNNNES